MVSRVDLNMAPPLRLRGLFPVSHFVWPMWDCDRIHR